MDCDFVVPAQPEELLEADDRRFFVEEDAPVTDMDTEEFETSLSELVSRLRDSGSCALSQHENFDLLFMAVKDWSQLEAAVRSELVTIVSSFFNQHIHNLASLAATAAAGGNKASAEHYVAIRSHRRVLKMYTFLTAWMLMQGEKLAARAPGGPGLAVLPARRRGAKKQQQSEDSETSRWETDREKLLNTLDSLFSNQSPEWWHSGRIDDDLSNIVVSCVVNLVENPQSLRARGVKDLSMSVMVGLSQCQGLESACNTGASFLNALMRSEHVPAYVAELLFSMSTHGEGYQQVGSGLMREISRIPVSEFMRDAAGAKNASTFLCEISDRLPRLANQNISFLMCFLDGEAYQLRSSIVHMVGNIVATLASECVPSTSADDKEEPHSRQMSPEASAKARDHMLEVLFERMRDVNAYTRSKTLQTWSKLVQLRCIPLNKISALVEAAVSRLNDKSAFVRRSAAQLLNAMLQFNPYGPNLQLDNFKEMLNEWRTKLQGEGEEAMEGASSSSPAKASTAAVSSEELSGSGETAVEEEFASSAMETDFGDMDPTDKDTMQEVIKVVTYHTQAIFFISQMERAVPTVCQLLGSKTVSDVQEAMQLVITMNQFHISKADMATRKMLTLIWSKEQGIKTALIDAFHRLYTACEDTHPGDMGIELIRLCQGASVSDITCMEETLCELMKEGKIHGKLIANLWRIFNNEGDSFPDQYSDMALVLLSMFSRQRPHLVANKLSLLLEDGLGEKAKGNTTRLRFTFTCLRRLATIQDKEGQPVRFSHNHLVCERIRTLCLDLSWCPSGSWVTLCDEMVAAGYEILSTPDLLFDEILASLTQLVSPVESPDVPQEERSTFLGRLVFLVGQVAMKKMVAMDAQHQRDKEELSKKMDGPVATASSSSSPEGRTTSKRRSRKPKGESDVDTELGIAAEMGFDDIQMADAELDERNECSIRMIVDGDTVVGRLAHRIAQICSTHQGPEGMPLQKAAVVSLCKLMVISPTFCEEHLRLLFTLFERSPSPAIRCSIAVALGDLASRFPNLVEPYNARIYARLRDAHPRVRKNVLMVLAHLILSDMVKVKGLVSEIALCLTDSEAAIRDTTMLFFHELAAKGGNIIYNIVPDIISRLSQDQDVSPQAFRDILKHLLEFVGKDKHADSLLEKICHRFSTTAEVQTWRCLAFCLSQLNVTEKGIKKLKEAFRLYKHTLSDAPTFEEFNNVVVKARKFAKPEVKELVEEWYDLLMSTQVPEEGEEVEGGEGDETAAVDLEEEINALEITESDVEEEEED